MCAAFTLGINNKMLTGAGAQRRENFPNSFKEKFCCSDGPESLSRAHVLKVQSESVGIRRQWEIQDAEPGLVVLWVLKEGCSTVILSSSTYLLTDP